MELIPSGTNFDFLGKRYLAFAFSLLLVAGSIYYWVKLGDAKFGIDFAGGNDITVRIPEAVDSDELSKLMETQGLRDVSAQRYEFDSTEYAIRFGGVDGGQGRDKVQAALKARWGDKATILQTNYVGPTVGEELKRKALIAVVISLIGILAYVSYQFEFAFALGAVVALFHDVIVATGVYLAFGHQLNMVSLAAALTIVGYSVNDTIVIFDRLREELRKQKRADPIVLVNKVMNDMLGRTIITSLLTLFSALALLFFGGGAISDLSLFLVVGIIAGSYSTIYIAAPIVILWDNFRGRMGHKQVIGAAAKS